MAAHLAYSTTRQHILEVASTLFYQEGIRAIGVDTIVERSGVGKATLYRHFPTKDDLIVAYLEENDRRFWSRFNKVVTSCEGKPAEQIVALFETLIKRLLKPDFRGCPFLNARVEFPNIDHPAHKFAIKHERELQESLSHLSQQAGARDPEQLANQLMLIINGAMVSTSLLNATAIALQCKTTATYLIQTQTEHIQTKH